MKDWIGNSQAVHSVNQRSRTAEKNDYYATDPQAVKLLLNNECFNSNIWEPACGEGHISRVLESNGYNVFSTDLIDRGFGSGNVDFLAKTFEQYQGDIVTNPPYKFASKFVEKAIETVADGCKVCMFLKLTFLEGKARKKLFSKYPPRRVWVCSERFKRGKNGDFSGEASAVAYCWIVWEKGYTGTTELHWLT